MLLMVRWNDEVSSCLPARSILVFCDSKWCREWVLRDCIAMSPEQSPLASPRMTQPSNTEIFPLVLETQPVSRMPMGKWKEFRRKDCQIILNLSELQRVEERQWEERFCEGVCLNFKLYFQLLSAPSLCPLVCLFVFLHTNICLDQPVCPSACLPGWQFAALLTCRLCLNL